MAEHELGNKLKDALEKAPVKESCAQVVLFAIKNADEIRNNRLNKREILKAAGIPEKRSNEIGLESYYQNM